MCTVKPIIEIFCVSVSQNYVKSDTESLTFSDLKIFSVYDQGALYHSSFRLVEANQTKQDQTEGNKGLIAECFGKTFLPVVIKRNNIQLTTSKTDNSVWQLCKGLVGLASVINLKNDMPQCKKILIRALELATEVLGNQHHFVAAILNKVSKICGRHFEQGQ